MNRRNPNSRRKPGTRGKPGNSRKKDGSAVFTPEDLDSSIIAVPLLNLIREQGPEAVQPVIIDLNLDYPGGRLKAKELVKGWVRGLLDAKPESSSAKPGKSGRKQAGPQGLNHAKSRFSDQYLFGELRGDVLQSLVKLDSEAAEHTAQGSRQRAIYHIWPDFEIQSFINKSISTVKADAARASFSAMGEDIVWAVMDSGVDKDHQHFALHRNLFQQDDVLLKHYDFTLVHNGEDGKGPAGVQEGIAASAAPAATASGPASGPSPAASDPLDDAVYRDAALEDGSGHGTHVAGIIAGELSEVKVEGAPEGPDAKRRVRAFSRHKNEAGKVLTVESQPLRMTGMAPKCKILSLKVLDENGRGRASNLIAAISYVQELNGHGRRLHVHGVNMSVGYEFEPKWFACGQSPLCVEVDRLARSGVVVVVAAGNTGYGVVMSEAKGAVGAGMDLSINDPGNAELAITVGSTHRDMPHVYGVSYFSSKGPTGDGRLKPDLVAPGEKILSCAAGRRKQEMLKQVGKDFEYLEDSGTSMAAPHVSGVIAAFLSIRREFIGQPEKVKEIFMDSATDLRRERYFQGKGLVDLMRAIQSV